MGGSPRRRCTALVYVSFHFRFVGQSRGLTHVLSLSPSPSLPPDATYQVQFALRDCQTVQTHVPEAQDARTIGHNDGVDVLIRAVPNHGLHLADVVIFFFFFFFFGKRYLSWFQSFTKAFRAATLPARDPRIEESREQRKMKKSSRSFRSSAEGAAARRNRFVVLRRWRKKKKNSPPPQTRKLTALK